MALPAGDVQPRGCDSTSMKSCLSDHNLAQGLQREMQLSPQADVHLNNSAQQQEISTAQIFIRPELHDPSHPHLPSFLSNSEKELTLCLDSP